jgi:glucose-1-phosphate cytidylyltransferase
MLTYGDAVCDIDITKVLDFHKSHGKAATITAVPVGQRFGVLTLDETDSITAFREKSEIDSSYINGGYMIMEPKVFEYLKDDTTVFEKEPLSRLSSENELKAYKYKGFWQCMDTKREKDMLDAMLNNGDVPWKVW